MAEVELSLKELKVPGIPSYVPAVGTKLADGQSLSTYQVCANVAMPFVTQQVKRIVLGENEDTLYLNSDIEYCATIIVELENAAYSSSEAVKFELGGSSGTPLHDMKTPIIVVNYTLRPLYVLRGTGFVIIESKNAGLILPKDNYIVGCSLPNLPLYDRA